MFMLAFRSEKFVWGFMVLFGLCVHDREWIFSFLMSTTLCLCSWILVEFTRSPRERPGHKNFTAISANISVYCSNGQIHFWSFGVLRLQLVVGNFWTRIIRSFYPLNCRDMNHGLCVSLSCYDLGLFFFSLRIWGLSFHQPFIALCCILCPVSC